MGARTSTADCLNIACFGPADPVQTVAMRALAAVRLSPALVRLVAVTMVLALAAPRAAAQSVSAPSITAESTPLVPVDATVEVAAWSLRPPSGGWSGGDRVEIQVGPPNALLPRSPCGTGSALVFDSLPVARADGGRPVVEAAFAKGTCENDTVALTVSKKGSGAVRLSNVRYDVGAGVAPGKVAVRATWVEVGLDDVTSPEPLRATAGSNARVALTATMTAESQPSVEIGAEASAGGWRLVPGPGKRWEAGEVVTIDVGDGALGCSSTGPVGFATTPSAGLDGPAVVATVSGGGPGEGCRLRLAIRPTTQTAARPIEVSGIRYRTTAGAAKGPVRVRATSDRTFVDDDDAANAVLAPAKVRPSTTTTTTTDPERDGRSVVGTVALVVLVVITLGGVALVFRRLLVLAAPGDLSAVADHYLGRHPGPELADAGPASRRVSQQLGGADWAGPVLATLLWDAFMRSSRYQASPPGAGIAPVVVRHAGGTRHDLVLLDPSFRGRRPRVVEVVMDAKGYAPTVAAERLGVDALVLQEALDEAARVGRFALLLAPFPKTVPVAGSASVSAFSVEADGHKVATTGVSVPGPRLAFTTALHAVTGKASIEVDGHAARVAVEHAATDSCLLEVPEGPPVPEWTHAGPLRALSPRQNEEVRFFGASSGAMTTRVTGWDISILAAQEVVGSKVYTPPDTAPGDSGAALFDAADHVLGFAVYVTGRRELIRYSAWVWADQVFRALGIDGPGR